MTAEQLAQLREVAERATPGDWRRASTRFNGITATPFTLGGEEVMLASASEKRDAEFIAAFHPAIALALLDEQERKDKRIAKLEARTVTVKLPAHKYRECVNGLLEEAIAYAGTQQLRERLSSRLANFVQPDHPHTRCAAGFKCEVKGE